MIFKKYFLRCRKKFEKEKEPEHVYTVTRIPVDFKYKNDVKNKVKLTHSTPEHEISNTGPKRKTIFEQDLEKNKQQRQNKKKTISSR